ncbi:hypothetical protein TorRG33x02_151480 [Trema orientale]|uniref:Uncharacterized protein n=1 Tax=Trema orientale TaxID=63057 RepID=A0A2P5EU51_TREOI|nr:hypothetical protein TorRG33x02_151480 [Trema orientale]
MMVMKFMPNQCGFRYMLFGWVNETGRCSSRRKGLICGQNFFKKKKKNLL